MKLTALFERLLLEDKRDFVLNQYHSKLIAAIKKDRSARRTGGNEDPDISRSNVMEPEDVVSVMHEKCSGPNGKHLVWVVRQYCQGDFRLEDWPRLEQAINKYEHVRNKMQHNDLMKYKSLAELEDELESLTPETSKRQKKLEIKREGADVLVDTPNVTIVQLKSVEAAKYYGKGTKWCTAAEKNNAFDVYADGGPLYVLIFADGTKYQLWFGFEQLGDDDDDYDDGDEFDDPHETFEVQFMDEQDRPVGPNDARVGLPEVTTFLSDLVLQNALGFFDDVTEIVEFAVAVGVHNPEIDGEISGRLEEVDDWHSLFRYAYVRQQRWPELEQFIADELGILNVAYGGQRLGAFAMGYLVNLHTRGMWSDELEKAIEQWWPKVPSEMRSWVLAHGEAKEYMAISHTKKEGRPSLPSNRSG